MRIKKSLSLLITIILSVSINAQQKWNQFRGDSKNSASIISDKEINSLPKIEWSTFLDSEIIASPVLTDSLVIISTDKSSIHFLNKINGKEVWKFETSGSIWSTPIEVNNKLYVISLDGHLYIFDINKRQLVKKIWLSKYDEKTYPESIYIRSGIKADKNNIYILAESHILAIDRVSNKINWKTEIRFGDTWSTPCIGSNFLYHLGDSELYIINKENGKIFDKIKIGLENFSSPSIESNTLVFNSKNGIFYSFNIKSKSITQIRNTDKQTLSSTALSNGNAYYGNSEGDIYSTKIASGKLKWTVNLEEVITASPIIINSIILFPTENGHLTAININTGQIQWKLKVKSGMKSSPAYDNGKIYIADKLGYVYALK